MGILETYGYKVELKLYQEMERSNSYDHGLSLDDLMASSEGNVDVVTMIDNDRG
jgi:hypothetical protein